MEMLAYNVPHDGQEAGGVPKQREQLKAGEEAFGDRLARLRSAAGYSLRELAMEVGISHRMIIYYEKHRGSPPAHLVPRLAKALGVSADQLLGLEPSQRKRNGARDSRLWRRFLQIEKLPPADRKPIIQVLDAFLAKARAE